MRETFYTVEENIKFYRFSCLTGRRKANGGQREENGEKRNEGKLFKARSANNNSAGNIISVIMMPTSDKKRAIFPSHNIVQYSPTSARITVNKGAIGNRTATLNSSI